MDLEQGSWEVSAMRIVLRGIDQRSSFRVREILGHYSLMSHENCRASSSASLPAVPQHCVVGSLDPYRVILLDCDRMEGCKILFGDPRLEKRKMERTRGAGESKEKRGRRYI